MAKHWELSEWPSLVAGRKPPQPTRRHTLPHAEEWMQRGACVGRWPEWDGAIDGERQAERAARQRRAAKVCRTACPVLAECRDWASRAQTVGQFGVVAGKTTRVVKGRQSGRWIEVA